MTNVIPLLPRDLRTPGFYRDLVARSLPEASDRRNYIVGEALKLLAQFADDAERPLDDRLSAASTVRDVLAHKGWAVL